MVSQMQSIFLACEMCHSQLFCMITFHVTPVQIITPLTEHCILCIQWTYSIDPIIPCIKIVNFLCRVMELSSTLMLSIMKESGMLIREVDGGGCTLRMAPYMKENGSMIFVMEKGCLE